MGQEWYNQAWEQYRQDKGLDFGFTTSYAHQQNRAAKYSMQTILDDACTGLAKSGLLLKYWAETVVTVVYVQNFISLSRHPGNILAEIWTGYQQDVSHLRPFRTIAYAHIPSDLSLSKLFP